MGKHCLVKAKILVEVQILLIEMGVLSGALVFFLSDSKIICENRLTFANFCGILELPLERLSLFSIVIYL